METGELEIDGVNIAYTRRGRGIPLVLIHGYPLEGSIWDQVAANLGRRVRYDNSGPAWVWQFGSRGCGSRHPCVRFRRGWSDGSAGRAEGECCAAIRWVATSRSALLRQYPERLLGLGLVASQMLPDPPDRRQARYAAAKEVLAKGVGPVAETMAPKLSSDEGIQAGMRVLISRQRPAGLASALEAMAERPNSTDVVSTARSRWWWCTGRPTP